MKPRGSRRSQSPLKAGSQGTTAQRCPVAQRRPSGRRHAFDRPPITRVSVLNARVNRAAINAVARGARLRDWHSCYPRVLCVSRVRLMLIRVLRHLRELRGSRPYKPRVRRSLSSCLTFEPSDERRSRSMVSPAPRRATKLAPASVLRECRARPAFGTRLGCRV
jgi:hypothetical protein